VHPRHRRHGRPGCHGGHPKHERRRVDGDLGAHGPVGVFQGLGRGDGGEPFSLPGAERAARGREDEASHLPGIVADIAILFFAAVAFALFKWIPITLTLPGIAGFLLSTGSALDANILIFERIKEELRSGRTLEQAIEQGWLKARSSIFDSNMATVITSLILFWFGSSFGATIVKGFSLTLMLGVAISLFTAIFVTRSLLALVLKVFKPKNLEFWFGI